MNKDYSAKLHIDGNNRHQLSDGPRVTMATGASFSWPTRARMKMRRATRPTITLAAKDLHSLGTQDALGRAQIASAASCDSGGIYIYINAGDGTSILGINKNC